MFGCIYLCKTLYPLTEQRKLPLQRATYEYLRGKILDVFSDYRKEAEDHLSKAVSNSRFWLCSWPIYDVYIELSFVKIDCPVVQVKLNPSLADAWLCLGNCIWKKGDLSAAKNCFILALSKVNVCKINVFHICFSLDWLLFLSLIIRPL